MVVYRMKPEAVEMVRIYHGAQSWPLQRLFPARRSGYCERKPV